MNLEYEVVLLPRAQRDLSKLPDSVVVKLEAAVLELANAPRSQGKKLKASKPIYSKRSGNFRLLFLIDDAAKKVIVQAIGDRKDIYKHFS